MGNPGLYDQLASSVGTLPPHGEVIVVDGPPHVLADASAACRSRTRAGSGKFPRLDSGIDSLWSWVATKAVRGCREFTRWFFPLERGMSARTPGFRRRLIAGSAPHAGDVPAASGRSQYPAHGCAASMRVFIRTWSPR